MPLITVCPNPAIWGKIVTRLRKAADKFKLPAPPEPLILSYWGTTNDTQKLERWSETLEWVRRHGLEHFLDDLEDGSMYRVDSLTDYRVGPEGGPLYLPWNFDPKPTASAAARSGAVQTLLARWTSIAGPELSPFTMPRRLTGAKGRRLVVTVVGAAIPPWGS